MKKFIYILIIAIGLLQVTGYLLDVKIIRGLSQSFGSSPLPIVFTEVKGVETFASDFFIHFTDSTGTEQERQITPAMYSKLKGPYNRRNIYGAAISYGSILKKELLEPVLHYALCRKVLVEEMGLPVSANNYSIRIKTKTAGRNDEWILTPECTP